MPRSGCSAFDGVNPNLKKIKKNLEKSFLDGVYPEVWITKFVHYRHSHKNKERFLKGKKKGKRFYLFLLRCYH